MLDPSPQTGRRNILHVPYPTRTAHMRSTRICRCGNVPATRRENTTPLGLPGDRRQGLCELAQMAAGRNDRCSRVERGHGRAPYNPHWAMRYPKRAARMALAGPAANLSLVVVAALLIRLGTGMGVLSAPSAVSFDQVVTATSGGAWDVSGRPSSPSHTTPPRGTITHGGRRAAL